MYYLSRFLLHLCLWFSLPLAAANRALLVGIDEYAHIPHVVGSVQDSVQMQAFIQREWGFKAHQIRRLNNHKATREGILRAFDQWLIEGSTVGDRVLFYFSGHGHFLPDDDGDEADAYDEALCPTDVDFIPPVGFSNMIRDDEISARLQQLAGREVLVILDACHSGTATRNLFAVKSSRFIKRPVFRQLTRSLGSKPPSALLQHQQEGGFLSDRPNVTVFSAVSANQIAIVDVEVLPYQGVFTRRIIEGIGQRKADVGGDGQVSAAELLDYTRRESQAYCERHLELCALRWLTPQLETATHKLSQPLFAGEVAIVVPTKITPTASQAANLLAHDNQAGLNLRLLPSTRTPMGKVVEFEISSQRSGRLLIFAVNPEEALVQVFPSAKCNQRNRDGWIAAGETIRIPDPYYGCVFRTLGPTGMGRLLALLVEETEAELSRDLWVEATLQGQPAQVWLARLRQRLDALVHQEDGGNRALRWSMTRVDYQVTD